MPEVKATFSLNEHIMGIVDNAGRNIWPEFAGNRSALMRKIIADWDRMRNEGGGGRMARIERLEERMALVERRLGIGDNHDTDHG